jgi:amino acid transporter
MDVKQIEKISTFAGVVLLALLAVFGILGCLELVFDIDYFASRRTADVWKVIPLITCVLIFCCFVVSTMLNVSRIASSVEKIVEKQDLGKD